MVWDKLARFYDPVESAYNGKVIRLSAEKTASYIDRYDNVLECACGTGLLSVPIAVRCKELTATDCSDGMLNQARKKLGNFCNVKLEKASITELPYGDCQFNKVVAANVIHLLDDPGKALDELLRVCKTGGKVIIPTYITAGNVSTSLAWGIFSKFGVGFMRKFDYGTYRDFFKGLGFENVEYSLIEGRMPSAIAVITKENI